MTGGLTIDAAAPVWAQRFAAAVGQALAALRVELRSQPLRPAQFRSVDLPDPARWPGTIIGVWNGAAYGLRFSDGSQWRPVALTEA